MWFDSQGTNSLEEHISYQLCADPEQAYAAELVAIRLAEEEARAKAEREE